MGHSGLRTVMKSQNKRKARYAGKDKLYKDLQSTNKMARLKRKQESKDGMVKCGKHPELMYLNLTRCGTLNDTDVSRMSLVFKKLVWLGLGQNTLLTDAAMGALAKNLFHLEYLNISGCTRLTDKGLLMVVKHCKKLRTINIAYCNFSQRFVDYLKGRGIRFIITPNFLVPQTTSVPRPRLSKDYLISPQVLSQLEKPDK